MSSKWVGFGALDDLQKKKREAKDAAASGDSAPTAVSTDVPSPVESAASTDVPTAVESPVDTAVPTGVDTAVQSPVSTPVPTGARTGVGTGVPTDVATAVDTGVSTGVRTAVPTGVRSPVTTDVPTAVASDSRPAAATYSREDPLDATHNAREKAVYNAMIRSERERYWSVPQLAFITGIRSDKTLRLAIVGLREKLSIDVLDENRGSHLGPKIRVYGPKEIMARRRAAGIEVEQQTKRVIRKTTAVGTAVDTGVRTGVGTPVATGGETYRGTAVEPTGPSLKHAENHDDDPIRSALRAIAPAAPGVELERAARQIAELVAAELVAAGDRATDVPAHANFGVEVIRRALERGKGKLRRVDTAAAGPGTNAPPEDRVARLKEVLEAFGESEARDFAAKFDYTDEEIRAALGEGD